MQKLPDHADGKGDDPPEKAAHGQKQAAKCEKIGRSTERTAQKHKNAVFSAANIKSKEQITGQKAKRKEKIRQMRQTGQTAPQTPQKIIKQPIAQPQKGAEQELTALKQQRQLHQPNRRRKKPPPVRSSS